MKCVKCDKLISEESDFVWVDIKTKNVLLKCCNCFEDVIISNSYENYLNDFRGKANI